MSSKGQKDGVFSFLPMDLSGKLIIKARLGDDIRRIPIFNEDITFDELILMLQRVFRGKLTNTDDVTLKYADEDGDLISIMDSSDLNLAKQMNRLLKLRVFINGKEPLPTLDASEVQNVKKELAAIRDKVNTLLDALEVPVKRGASESLASLSQRQPVTVAHTATITKPLEPVVAQESKPNPAQLSMFDPLKPSTPQTAKPPPMGSVTPSSSQHQGEGSTSHLFSQAAESTGFPLTSTTPQQQQQGYAREGYSASPAPSAPQQQQQQQQPQQADPYYLQQQQQQQQATSQPPPPQSQYSNTSSSSSSSSSQQYGTQPGYPSVSQPSAPMPQQQQQQQQPASYQGGQSPSAYPGQQQQQQTPPPSGYAYPYGGAAQPAPTAAAGQAGFPFPKQGSQYTQQAYGVYRNQQY